MQQLEHPSPFAYWLQRIKIRDCAPAQKINTQSSRNTSRQEFQKSLEAQPTTQPQLTPQYTGQPNPELETPITIQEIETTVQGLTRNTTPGKDKIQNKLLRNLDPIALKNLLTYMNEHWMNGTLPPQWEHAAITLIPKPANPSHSRTSVLSHLHHAWANFSSTRFITVSHLP